MQVGELVEITHRGGVLYAGKVGVITEHYPASMSAPFEVLEVTFANGDCLNGITPRWIRVLSASR